MENLALIKDLFQDVLAANNVILYDLKFVNENKMRILQVSIMNEDYSMDIDTCAIVSEQLSKVLDEHDVISSEYFLEVCSPGAEREIKDFSEFKKLTGKHIFIRLAHPVKKMLEITGNLLEANDNNLVIAYRDKALTKKVEVEIKEITYARLAVKI